MFKKKFQVFWKCLWVLQCFCGNRIFFWYFFGMIQSDVLSDTFNHSTVAKRLIVWLIRLKCTGKLIHLHVLSPWPFHHRFEPIWFSSTKILFENGFFVFWAVLVLIELLPMIKKGYFRVSRLVNQSIKAPASVVGLQFFSPADVPTHPL